MNFEPCNPPLLDPFIIQQFTAEETRKKEQALRHQYVLKKLADFLPKPSKPTPPSYPMFSVQTGHIKPHFDQRSLNCHSNYSQNTPPLFPPSFYQNIPKHKSSNLYYRKALADSSILKLPTGHLQKPPTEQDHLRFSHFTTADFFPASLSHQKQHKTNHRATKRFTYAQSVALEEFYQKYGSGQIDDRVNLAHQLGLYKNDVIMWFQSRRRKARRAQSMNPVHDLVTTNGAQQHGVIQSI